MKYIKVLVLAMLLLAVMAIPVLAQDEGPVLADPTDLMQVLVWLASGGAGLFVPVIIEKLAWFQALKKNVKPYVVGAAIVLVALIPQILLDVVPANLWEVAGPYFATIMTAMLIGYPASQLMHKIVNK